MQTPNDAALWLRWACRPNTSLKHDMKAGPSLNTIASVMRQRDHEGAWDISHQAIVLKAGLRLGLLKAA